MRVLGLEGTAWAASAAIVDVETGVVAMETRAYRPESGGIHPREAAEHMASALPSVIDGVIAATDDPIHVIAFSRGPGLGPCLRLVATAARTLSQRLEVPLVGVNHMIAHLEVGRRQSGYADPICLNASGANAHVLGLFGDRYRVLGETMDTGVGNAIDKFTRHLGWSHPGGPKVEEHAAGGSYRELPYVVKGMDFSFSGIVSAATDAIDAGEAVEDVCFSLQETIFAMLAEVSERALSLTGRDALVLGGGVGQNARLQEMLATMCEAREASFFAPEGRFLRDNAGMIAMLGAEMAAAGQTIAIEDSSIRAEYRPDEVPVRWREPLHVVGGAAETRIERGAEATVTIEDDRVSKTRVPKAYRHQALDARLRRERTAAEARLTSLARRAGIPTPVVHEVDLAEARLTLGRVGEDDLRDVVTADGVRAVGEHLAALHGAGIVHGDPTTRNVRVAPAEPGRTDSDRGRVYLIDFGLGYHSRHVEDRAMDLHVFQQSADGTTAESDRLREAIEVGYADGAMEAGIDAEEVFGRLDEIEGRGRYR